MSFYFAGHEGNRYLVMFPQFEYGNTTVAQILITAHQDITVSLKSPFPGVSRTVFVSAKDGATVSLPPEIMQRGNAIEQKGVLVESDFDFSVYGYNQRNSFRRTRQIIRGETYAAIPTEYLGTSYFYVGHTFSFLSIVALYDDTRVNITFNYYTPHPYNGKTFKSGDTLTVYLSSLSTFQLKGNYHLFNTDIKSDKPIGVVSGCTCYWQYIGPGYGYCNQLMSYLPPVNRLGDTFIIPHIPSANNTDIYLFSEYVDSSNHYIQVRYSILRRGFNRTRHFFGYSRGDSCPSNVPYIVKTNSPSIVIQQTTVYNSRTTYPAQILIPAVTQYSNNYKFITPSNQPYDNYAAIIIRSDDVSGLRFDGGKIYKMDADIKTVTDTETLYTVISMKITTGQHSMDHVDDDVVFGLILYGFGGRHAYGMPAGLDLSKTND